MPPMAPGAAHAVGPPSAARDEHESVGVRLRALLLRLARWRSPSRRHRPGGRLAALAPWLLLVVVTCRSIPGLLEGNDFAVYYAAGEAVLDGGDIFESAGIEAGRRYIYPPTLAVLVAPLAALPFPLAATLWGLLNGTAIVVALRLTLRLVESCDAAERWALALVGLVLAARPLDSELGNGQVNLLVLCAVLAGLRALQTRRSFSAGGWLALAACVKVTPALFLGYLVVRREWRALAGWLVGAAVCLVALPAIAFGDPAAGPRDTLEWSRRVASPVLRTVSEAPGPSPGTRTRGSRNRAHEAAYAAGHSLRALAYRFLSRSPLSYRDRDDPTYATVVDLGRETAQAVYGAVAALILVLTVIATGVRRARPPPRRLALEAALWLTAMLLISPVSRKAHFVSLLPAFTCGAALVLRSARTGAVVWLSGCLIAYLLAAKAVTGDHLSMVLRNSGLYTVTALIPWAALAWACWRGEVVPAPTAPSSASVDMRPGAEP